MVEYKCNSTRNIYILSELCFDNQNTGLECVAPYGKTELDLQYIHGSVYVLIGVISIIGNLVTVFSIPFAARNKLHGFDYKFREITLFILNLCFVDLCTSLMCILPTSIEDFSNNWPFGKTSCVLEVIIGLTMQLTAPLSIALISVSRYLDLAKSKLWGKWTHNNLTLFITLLLPWLLSSIAIIPYFVPSMKLEFGWDCIGRACGIILKCETDSCNDEYWIGLDLIEWYITTMLFISVAITTISYVLLWRRARDSAKCLKRGGIITNELLNREVKMTRTILLLLVIHGICNLPIAIFQIAASVLEFANIQKEGFQEGFQILAYIFSLAYMAQFGLNFFICIGSNEQYQMAYVTFWRYITLQAKIPHDEREKVHK